MRPTGAPGLVDPHSPIGYAISARQGIGKSHAIIALGNGKVFDSTAPWARITPEAYWEDRGVDWWAPDPPFDDHDTRELRSACYAMEGKVRYAYCQLLKFAILGVPEKKSHYLFCTQAVAELYMIARDYDMSGCEQPGRIDLRELLVALQNGPFIRMLK